MIQASSVRETPQAASWSLPTQAQGLYLAHFYSGATAKPIGRFIEGVLLRLLHDAARVAGYSSGRCPRRQIAPSLAAPFCRGPYLAAAC